MTDATEVPEARWFLRDGERFNFYSHAGGLLASLAGACWMLAWTWQAVDWAVRLSILVYLGTLVGTFAASSALHFFLVRRTTWERLDHSMIYALIAGTCTPFVATTVSNAIGPWAALSLLWVFTATCIRQQWNRDSAESAPAVGLCAALGCLAVLGATTLVVGRNDGALVWLWVGAGAYGIGTWFYQNRGGFRHAHGIWHLLVLAGAGAHYVSICLLLVPRP